MPDEIAARRRDAVGEGRENVEAVVPREVRRADRDLDERACRLRQRSVCSKARLAAGTKVLIARGGEGVGTPFERFEWRADSQRKLPSRAVPLKGKRRQSRSKAKQKQKKHSQRTMGEAGGREQKGEAAASGERRRRGSVCAVRWAQRGSHSLPPFPLSLSADT